MTVLPPLSDKNKVSPEQEIIKSHAVEVDGEATSNASYFSFRDVWASVIKSGKEETILHNVSGFCKPTVLNALMQPGESVIIMGPSGAGKSTLLDTLGFRKSVGKWGGDFRINGSTCTKKQFIRHSGYVTSDDVESPNLTVKETLLFAAGLRLPCKLSLAERQKRVQDVMEDMHLTLRANNKVGSITARGLSTGERKRLSIAIELLSVTSVLFLDEPTTGLDSNTGRETVTRILEASKKRQLATIMTIHQPSYQILQQFDRLLLLAKGKVCYFGPTLDAVPYFENLGVKIIGNPAETYAEVLAVQHEEMAKAYAESSLYQDNIKKIEAINSQLGSVNMFINASSANKESVFAMIGFWQEAPWYKQLLSLSLRELKIYCRDPLMSLSRYVASTSTALFFGFAFYQLGSNTHAYDAKMTLNFAVSILPGLYCTACIPHWLEARKLYYLQVTAGFFHPFFWLLVSFIMECIFCGSMMAVLINILYSLAGWDVSGLGLYTGLLVLSTFGNVGYCLFVTMISSSVPYAMTGFNIFFFVNTIFGGYYVLDSYLQTNCPFCYSTLKWISVHRGFLKGAQRREAYGKPIACNPDELIIFPFGNITLGGMVIASKNLQSQLLGYSSSLTSSFATSATSGATALNQAIATNNNLKLLTYAESNVAALLAAGAISPPFPSISYQSLLSTLHGSLNQTLTTSLNVTTSNLPVVEGLINSIGSVNYIAANIMKYKFALPDHPVCPWADGTAYLYGMQGFTTGDTWQGTSDSFYEGYMVAHAVITFILAYVALIFCKYQKR